HPLSPTPFPYTTLFRSGDLGPSWWRDYAPQTRPTRATGLIDRLSVCYYSAVARTLDLEKHTVRKEAFVEAAQRLLQTKGYEAMRDRKSTRLNSSHDQIS